MRVGLVVRILSLQAAIFVLAAVALPILVFQLPKAAAVLYLALTFAAVLGISGLLIGWRIVRPLQGLIAAAESATSPDENLVPESEGADELGRLTRALNRMVRRLGERQRALEHNVAELEAQRRALERAHEALQRSERLASVGRLAAGVAHEVGNPIASIQGYLGLLASADTPADERADYLVRVEREVDRVHHLLRDLMDYARPPAPRLDPVDVSRPIEAAVNLLAAQPRFRAVDVVRKYAADLRPVLGDDARLLQVMLNLLLNAADAMEGTGRIEVRVAFAPESFDRIEIAVADQGPGIPPEHRERIFEPFFSTKEPGRGTGLGLAISKSIIESLGGEIDVRSSVGRGATFLIRLATAPRA